MTHNIGQVDIRARNIVRDMKDYSVIERDQFIMRTNTLSIYVPNKKLQNREAKSARTRRKRKSQQL